MKWILIIFVAQVPSILSQSDMPRTCKEQNPCLNGGRCKYNAGSPVKCDCKNGFEGKKCQANINECEPNPCFHGGTCNDGINDFRCICPEGYSGKQCLTIKNRCDNKPCMHDGRCFPTPDGNFRCLCKGRYKGKKCHTKRLKYVWTEKKSGCIRRDPLETMYVTGLNECKAKCEVNEFCRSVDIAYTNVSNGTDFICCLNGVFSQNGDFLKSCGSFEFSEIVTFDDL